MPVLPNLFAQFRHQHANGSLITELLMPHAEQYLVKATISIEGQVIGTALAADKDLAAADDQAKARVLAMLGFAQEPTALTVSQEPLASGVVASQENHPPHDQPDVKAMAADKNPAAVSTVASDEPEPNDSNEALEGDDDMGRPLDSFTPEEAPAPAEVPASSLAATAIENFDDTHPVDLSDIIAQTDVEMTRLGWSSSQGRSYLEQTFHKRSRQQLTDEELLTFLLYLESQTTPSLG
ncbi:MAG: hypothetical protein AAF821_01805 [Cyanobacteria bacterium P01_D01_bin.156]